MATSVSLEIGEGGKSRRWKTRQEAFATVLPNQWLWLDLVVIGVEVMQNGCILGILKVACQDLLIDRLVGGNGESV